MYLGSKVRLRAFCDTDIPIFQEYFNDPEIQRLYWPDIPFPCTLQNTAKFFESISAESLKEYYFAIEELAEKKFIGSCGINKIDWKNSLAVAEIFIGDKRYQGQGYGSDAVKTLSSFIFGQMNINKIKLCVFSSNAQAIAAYKKCGFTVEGILRQEIYRDGSYCDLIAMGLLKEDFYSNDCKKNTYNI